MRDLREHLERLRRELEEAEGNYDLNKAELRHGKIPAIEKELKKQKKWARIINKKIVYYVEEVSEEEITDIVSRWTGIPVAKLVEGEREKLLRLEQILSERVIGPRGSSKLSI
ncbi:type VI secretion system ATPase TssH, partial [Bacillus cereus]